MEKLKIFEGSSAYVENEFNRWQFKNRGKVQVVRVLQNHFYLEYSKKI